MINYLGQYSNLVKIKGVFVPNNPGKYFDVPFLLISERLPVLPYAMKNAKPSRITSKLHLNAYQIESIIGFRF